MPAEHAPWRPAAGSAGRVAIVTGASRGFGAQLAGRLGQAGWAVITVSRTPRPAVAGPGSRHVIADVGSAGAAARVAEALSGRPLQLLVNNAGQGASGTTLATATRDELQAALDTNLLGALELIRACEPNLRSGRPALVINVTSRLASIQRQAEGFYGAADLGASYAYRIAKAAQNMLSSVAAAELGPVGVGVWAVHPGRLTTAMAAPDADTDPAAAAAALVQLIAERDPEDTAARFISLDARENAGRDLPW